jgi:putative phosphoesterase
MKIGVISDTHDQIESIIKMVAMLNQEKVGLVIHCGDWVAPFTLEHYKKLNCPLKGVFGNNDGDKFRHLLRKEFFQVDIQFEDLCLELEVENRKIAVFHGHGDPLTQALIKCGAYDAVFHGHTHERVNETVGKTLSLNPGTLIQARAATDSPAGFAIYDTETNTATFREV